jgi:hypothetical protein
MMNPLVHTMEAEFHGASNIAALRALHKKGDINGLLEYALLLADQEASQRSQIQWLIKEVTLSQRGIEQWHMDLAAELLGN